MEEPFFSYPYYSTGTNPDADFDIGTYFTDIYKVSVTIPHDPMVTGDILHFWERHSSSNTFGLHDDNFVVKPFEKVRITNINQSTATLEGYFYEMFDFSGNSLGWMPFNPFGNDPIRFAYSVIAEDESINTENLIEDLGVQIIPNPATDMVAINLNLGVSKDLLVELFDVRGVKIANLFSGVVDNNLSITHDISQLSQGVYFVKISSADQLISKRLIKQ